MMHIILQKSPFIKQVTLCFIVFCLTGLLHPLSAQIVPTEATAQCFLGGNGGIFQDIGGTEDYPNCSCVTTTTICSVDGSALTIEFTSFSVNEPFDWLVILDNDNLAGDEFPMGTQLFNNSDGVGDGGADNYGLGANAGEGTMAELTTNIFTSTNLSGCLTFVFRSSGVVAEAGWEATITTAGGGAHPGDDIDCSANISCLSPSSLMIDNVGAINADLSWNVVDSATVYIAEYGPSGFMLGTGTSFNTTLTSANLINLTQNTSYDFYISAECVNGDTSTTVGPVTFLTKWLNDVGIVAVFTPESECGLGDEMIEVTLTNFGENPQSLIPFKYSVNNIDAGVSQPLDGFYTGVLSTDSTVTIAFETTFDYSVGGEYEVIAWTFLDTDFNTANDSTSGIVTSIPTVSDFPYFIDFETWDGGWTIETEISENSSWEFGTPTTVDISSAASGLNAFVTNLTGNYNNLELSYIISPCFDFSSLGVDPVINFSINYDTETSWDGAWLDVSIDGGFSWSKVGTIGTGVNWYTVDNTTQGLGDVWGGNSGGWLNAENTLTGIAGQSNVRFRFAFDTDGSGNNFDGIGIDDILITPIFADDLATVGLTNSTDSDCGIEDDFVTVDIRNSGVNPQTGFDVSYQVNGGFVITENVGALLLNQGDIVPYTFATPFNSNVIGEVFEFRSWTSFPGELNFLNDTSSYVYSTLADLLPIVIDFEDLVVPEGWTTSDIGIGNGHNNASVAIYDNIYSGDPNYEVNSPIIGPINAGDSLTFDYRYTDWSAGTAGTILGAGDQLEVFISIDCGDNYTLVETIDQSNHVTSAIMTNKVVDLNSFAGEFIKIRFVATWGSGDYWLDLDNINIIGCPPDLGLEVTTTNETAEGAADGTATINPGQGEGPYTFDWSNGNASSSDDDLEAGEYMVTVMDANGCSSVITFVVEMDLVGTEDLEDQFANISLVPNPTSGLAELTVELNESAEISVQVLNVVGQVIFEAPREELLTKKYQLDLTEQAGGMYFVRIAGENQSQIVKLIKAQ